MELPTDDSKDELTKKINKTCMKAVADSIISVEKEATDKASVAKDAADKATKETDPGKKAALLKGNSSG
jgi:hypothetical protein